MPTNEAQPLDTCGLRVQGPLLAAALVLMHTPRHESKGEEDATIVSHSYWLANSVTEEVYRAWPGRAYFGSQKDSLRQIVPLKNAPHVDGTQGQADDGLLRRSVGRSQAARAAVLVDSRPQQHRDWCVTAVLASKPAQMQEISLRKAVLRLSKKCLDDTRHRW